MAEVWLEKSLALGREAENKSIQRDMGHAMLSKVEDGHGFHGQPRTERKWKTGKQKLKEKKAITHIRRQYGFKKLTLKQDLLKSPEGFPGGSEVKNPPSSAGNMGSIPGLGRSLGGGNGIPPQYSCLENSMDRGSSWATVHGVAESATTETTKRRVPRV